MHRAAKRTACGAAAMLACAVALSGVTAEEGRKLLAKPHYAQAARIFARVLPREHLSRQKLDGMVAARAWTNFLTVLDYDRVYFLASDVERFRAAEAALGEDLAAGRVDFAFEVFDVFKQRVRERYDFVDRLLIGGFDLTAQESYHWSRKDAPWPATAEERDELWRKRIKNEYVRRIVAMELDKEKKKDEPEAGEPKPEEKDSLLTPEEFIRKRYKQYLTVLEDNDADWVMQEFMTAFARAYDPHSNYMSPAAVEDFDIEMKLSLVGIGALLTSEEGAAKVVRLIPGGPADRDKRPERLAPGDKIIAVGQGDQPAVDTLHWPLTRVVRLIRGEKGSRVVLTVLPAADPTGTATKQVDLVRDEVKLEDEAASSRTETIVDSGGVSHTLGIVTLPSFYANMKVTSVNAEDYRSAAYDVEKAIRQLREKNPEGLLLDLRNNGGGSLPEAVRLSGLFIPSGPVVQVKEGLRVKVLADTDASVAYGGPLVVLVNRLSASASEIVAGAMQDYGRAVVVGDSKTHGKGSVQSILELGHDVKLGSIKITTASYYRITGNSTQLKGVTPDIVVSSPFDTMELGEDFLPNPLVCEPIGRVSYQPWTNLAVAVAAVKAGSEKRRATEPRFSAYTNFLSHLDQLNRRKEVSLQLDERRALAREEQELTDIQRKLQEEATADRSKTNAPPDIMLVEGLRILADLAAMDHRAHPQPRGPQAPPSLWQKLIDLVGATR